MSRSLFASASLLFVVFAVSAPSARAQGLLGNGDMAVGGSLLFGERLDGGGFGLSAQFEYASVFEKTGIGNWMGIEFLSELGYESYSGTDPRGGDFTQGPLIFDMAVGFPITLLKLGSGGPGSTLVSFAIGGGMSVQHAYGYVRGRILVTLAATTFIELMGRWTPSDASSDWTTKTGLDVYQLRASLYLHANEDWDLRFFAYWTPADRTVIGDQDPANVATFPPETTRHFQSVFQVGASLVF